MRDEPWDQPSPSDLAEDEREQWRAANPMGCVTCRGRGVVNVTRSDDGFFGDTCEDCDGTGDRQFTVAERLADHDPTRYPNPKETHHGNN